jgi:hypothetical protein
MPRPEDRPVGTSQGRQIDATKIVRNKTVVKVSGIGNHDKNAFSNLRWETQ